MSSQAADSFLTGGRTAGSGVPTVGTTISWWSPSSDGKNWVAQAATSTFAYDGVGFRGSTTNSTTANIATLNDATGRAWYSSAPVYGEFLKTAVADSCGVIARLQDVNNYYRAEVANNNLNIVKVVSGTGTTIATTPFTDGGAKFWIKFYCVGFGLNGTYNNLQAAAWLDGNSEPAYQIGASDASLTQTGLVGVRMKGSGAGQTQYCYNFSAADAPAITPAPVYNVTRDIPPGQTYYQGANPLPISPQVITDLVGLGNGAHLRLQFQWKTAEPLANFYQLDLLDHAVYLCNQAGIRVCLVLQTAPTFRLTRDGCGNNTTLSAARNSGTAYGTLAVAALVAGTYLPHKTQIAVDQSGAHPENVYVWNPGSTYTAGATSIAISTSTASQINWTPAFTHAIGAQIYEATGGPQLPGPAEMATYAGVVAARYNGTAGYGTIEEIEIGNEEWDAQTRFPGNADNGGGVLAPVINAAYPAIQAVYPTCIIIRASVRKTPTLAEAHITTWETLFWSNLTINTANPITADAHYYVSTDPTVQTTNTPSVTTEASTILSIAAAQGFTNVQLLFGEFGYLQWDDGGGATATVATSALAAGIPITSLNCSALSAAMPAGTPITFDYGSGSNQEGYATNPVYAKGANAAGATTLNITTDPAGSASNAWKPTFTHAIGSQIYGTTHTPILDPTAIAGFTKSMYDALKPFHAHAYYFTLNDTSVVHTTTTPQWADAPRSLVQTINGVYTYAPAYYTIANYVWFPPSSTTGPYTVSVGGQAVFVQERTLAVQSVIGRRSTANFTVHAQSAAAIQQYVPRIFGGTLLFAQAQAALTHFQQFQPVQVQDGNGVLAFSGFIATPQEQKPGFPNALDTQIVCMDQHFLADKRVVATLYRNQTFGYIVNDMLVNILSQEGVTVGQIAAGPIIPVANFGYVSVASAMDALVAAASSSGVPYYWQIDQNLLLWAVPYTAVVGPAVDGTQVDDGRLSGFAPIVTRANPKYRNTQYAVGGVAQTSVQTEIHVGDGNTQSFPMGFALASTPTITINIGAGYVSQTVGLKGQTGYQWYWAAGDNTVTQDSSGVKLRGTPSNDLLKVVYTGQFSTVFTAQNAAEVTAQAAIDQTSGIIEAVLTDNTIATSADGLAKCNQQLTQYGVRGTRFEFATRATGFAAGQLIPINYAPLGFSNTQMLIEELDLSDQQDGFNIWFIVHAVAGPYDTSWVNFFANLLQPATIANNINLGVSLNVPLAPSTTLAPSNTLAPG